MRKLRKYKIHIGNEDVVYEGCWHKGRPDRFGIMESYSKEKCEGNWVEGVRQGKSIYEWKDQSKFVGSFQDGEMEGLGKFTWPNATSFEGEFKHGVREGHGKLTNSAGDIYDGEFKKDKREGFGKLFWTPPNSSVKEILKFYSCENYQNSFEGNWSDDVPSGLGIRKTAGVTSFGVYEKGKLSGFGEVDFVDGSKYTGEFRDGLFDGYGKKELKVGSKTWYSYEGMWRKGVREGHGIMSFENRSKYDGDWENDKPSGNGMLFVRELSCLLVEFKDGVLISTKQKYSLDDEFAKTCLQGRNKETICNCLLRAIKFRYSITPTMFTDENYPFVREVRAVFYAGTENLRLVRGTPATKLYRNKRY